MGLENYRPYKDEFPDEGLEIYETLPEEFAPDFRNRHTIQMWNASALAEYTVTKWKGVTLNERTLHEITIANNSNISKNIKFSNSYEFPDDTSVDGHTVTIGPNGAAYFYATAIYRENNLVLVLRTGSQDKRNTV